MIQKISNFSVLAKRMLGIGLLLATALILALNTLSSAVVPGNNTLVSLDYQGNAVLSSSFYGASADGNSILFMSNRDDVVNMTYSYPVQPQLYIRNLQDGTVKLVTKSTSGVNSSGQAASPYVSENGRYVVYASRATDLVSGVTGFIGMSEVYLYDTESDTTTLVSQSTAGSPANENVLPDGVSNDGRFVFFTGYPTNLATITPPAGNPTYHPGQVFVKDMAAGAMTIVSKSNSGINDLAGIISGSSTVSCDGSFVAFTSYASNLDASNNNNKNQLYLADLRNGFRLETITINANEGVYYPRISCNGNYVIFISGSSNLTSETVTRGQNHVYIYDRLSGVMKIASRTTTDTPGWAASANSVSNEGIVTYESPNQALTSVNINYVQQVFLYSLRTNTTELLSINASGAANTGSSYDAYISMDGKSAVFGSGIGNITSTAGTIRSITGH